LHSFRASGNGGGGGGGGWALVALSILDIGLSVMMAALGVMTIIKVKGAGVGKDFAVPFLAAYMIMFALLLFLYELMWWTPLPVVNRAMRKNFGFLYGLRGKGLYLIFVACLCLGLGKKSSVKQLNWATGFAFLAVGCLHIFVIFSHPDLALKYVAPTAGLTTSESTEDPNANVV
jgi:hypothetical protein